MKNNVYLAKIVSFDNYSLLFEINDLHASEEEYRLVAIYDRYAYDLITKQRYYVLEVSNGLIVNEDLYNLKQGIRYVYEVYPLIDIWENIKGTFNIESDMNTFLEKNINGTEELNRLLTSSKIIDINKIKKIIK